MPEISLTDFVDVVIKAGSPKLTKVRQLVERGEYSPAFDYWKPLREGIQEFHRGERTLDSILDALDVKKQRKYTQALLGYKKFLRKKHITYFEAPYAKWEHSGLTVRVNPEVGLILNGERHVIKLYFKDEAPTPHRLDAVMELMRLALSADSGGAKYAVVDVSKGKLIVGTKTNPDYAALLQAEATSLVTMWTALGGKKKAKQVAAS